MVVSGSRGRPRAVGIDRVRLARRVLIVGLIVIAGFALVRNVLGSQYAFDFHGIWQAGHDLLRGRSPYLAPEPRVLLRTGNAFIAPPVLAVLAVPFSILPLGAAVALWNLACAAAVVAGLRLLGVRDRRLYVLTLCSFPCLSSFVLGQPDGFLLLAGAIAWRDRESWKGALAVGALIAAKLFAWPLLLWLLITGRIRCSLLALASAVGLIALSWATIGFSGLLAYPKLLSADAHVFEARSHSPVAAALALGASQSLAFVLALLFATGVAVAVVRVSRNSDVGWFTAALTLGLLTSPILWSHYLLLLFVPLSITRRRLDWVWVLAATAFWLSPIEPAHGWQIDLVLLTASTIAVMSGRRGPTAGSTPDLPTLGSDERSTTLIRVP